jgi:hypothetical protein
MSPWSIARCPLIFSGTVAAEIGLTVGRVLHIFSEIDEVRRAHFDGLGAPNRGFFAGGGRGGIGAGSSYASRSPATDSTSSMARGFFLPSMRWPSAVMTASSSFRIPPNPL